MRTVITASSVTKNIVTYVAEVVNLFLSSINIIKVSIFLLTLMILMKFYFG